MSIFNALYPQGNFLNIKANAPTQTDYNIRATEDLVRNLPGGFLRDIIAPAAAATLSLPYDTIQGISRADSYTPSGIMKAIAAENPLSSAYERFIGASGPLAERINNLNLFNSAVAAEKPTVPNLSLDYNIPTFDLATGITNTSTDLPFRSMVDMQEAANQDLVQKIIAENQAINYRRLMTQPGLDKFTGINKGVYDPYGIKTEDGRFSYDMNKTSLADYQTMAPQQTFQDYYSGIYEPYDPEKDDEQVDYLPGQYSFKDRVGKFARNVIGQPGISSLIGFINPVAGLVSRGLGYLGKNLSPSFVGPKGARGYGSESVGGLFARSNTLADFFQNVRDKRARDAAAARGAAKQAEQKKMNEFRAIRDSQPSGGGGGGGIGSSYGGAASPGSQGPGGSDAMGSF
jgi:hypothetical protein